MGITGFGSSLVMVPMLAQIWPLNEAVSLAIMLDVPACILHGGLNFKNVRWDELYKLIPSVFFGAAIGIWLIPLINKIWLLLVLGTYVIWVGLNSISVKTKPNPLKIYWSVIAGVGIGVVEALFATAGPVVVAWLQKRLNEVNEIRASVPVTMIFAGTIAFILLGQHDLLALDRTLPRWSLTFPIAVIGILLGNKMASKINPILMRKIMAILLCISGLALLKKFSSLIL
jgi:uncharacterized membrane protein YfcA